MTYEEKLATAARKGFDELLTLWADPAKWTQYVNARDKNGEEVDADLDEAVCWCLAGGIMRAARNVAPLSSSFFNRSDVVSEMERRVQEVVAARGHIGRNPSFYKWNDEPGRTIGEVLEVVKAARAL